MLLVRLPAAGQFPGSDLGPAKFSKNFLLASVRLFTHFLSCQQLIATTIAIDILIYPQMSSFPVIDCSIDDCYNSHATGLNSFRQF